MSEAVDGPNRTQAEQAALQWSIAGALVMAVVGIGFAAAAQSQAVLLDGMFSLVGFAMTVISTRIAAVVEEPSTPDFPFGKGALEPLMNTARGLVVAIVLLFAAVSALVDLGSGGRPLSAGVALTYSVVAGSLCLLMSWRQRQVAEQTGSSIIAVDAQSWQVDGSISLAVGLAFVLSLVLGAFEVTAPLPYIDPVVVLLMVAALSKEPVQTVWANLTELLQAAPDPDVQQAARDAVERHSAELVCRERQVKLSRIGRYLYVRITFLLGDPDEPVHVADLDRIRGAITDELADQAAVVKVDCLFTGQERWMGRAWLRAKDRATE